jgi:hypothetical protein
MESRGLEAEALERERRLAFIDEVATGESREEALRRMSEAGEGHSVWAAFDWAGRGDRESVLREQWKLTSFIAGRQVVIKTAILEETLEGWPPEDPAPLPDLALRDALGLQRGPFPEPDGAAAGGLKISLRSAVVVRHQVMEDSKLFGGR